MTPPINHIVNWRYICQRKQDQIEKDVICENSTIIYHDYRVGDQITINNNTAFKYKTPFKGPYEIDQTWTSGTVTIQTRAVASRMNIRHIKPYNNPEV